MGAITFLTYPIRHWSGGLNEMPNQPLARPIIQAHWAKQTKPMKNQQAQEEYVKLDPQRHSILIKDSNHAINKFYHSLFNICSFATLIFIQYILLFPWSARLHVADLSIAGDHQKLTGSTWLAQRFMMFPLPT